ncbi:MAG: hypothetical protein JW797_02845 [Bradymonadales bacterium]|nr:hypothetical protein [Bradymonadales bacterium]
MFRFSKLYLVAVVLLATFLVILLQFGPKLFDKALRQRLQTESDLDRSAFVQWLQLVDLRQLCWTEEMAVNPTVCALTERMEWQDPHIFASGIEEWRRTFGGQLTGATAHQRDLVSGLSLDVLAIIDARRQVNGAYWSADFDSAQLLGLPEVEAVLAGQSSSRGLELLADGIYSIACAKIPDAAGGIGGVLVAARRLDRALLATFLSEFNTAADLDILLFRDDGGVVCSTGDRNGAGEEIHSRAENYLVWLAGNNAIPTDPTHPGEVQVVDTSDRVVAMVAGRLPDRGDRDDTRPLGFLLIRSNEAVPASFAAFLFRQPDLLQPSRELLITIGLGLALLAIGLVIFGLEGRRYHKTVNRLRKQIARVTTSAEEVKSSPPGETPVRRATDVPFETGPQPLPSSTAPVDIEEPRPIFEPEPEPPPKEPDTIQAVPSRIMGSTEEAGEPQPLFASESLLADQDRSPITLTATPHRILQESVDGQPSEVAEPIALPALEESQAEERRGLIESVPLAEPPESGVDEASALPLLDRSDQETTPGMLALEPTGEPLAQEPPRFEALEEPPAIEPPVSGTASEPFPLTQPPAMSPPMADEPTAQPAGATTAHVPPKEPLPPEEPSWTAPSLETLRSQLKVQRQVPRPLGTPVVTTPVGEASPIPPPPLATPSEEQGAPAPVPSTAAQLAPPEPTQGPALMPPEPAPEAAVASPLTAAPTDAVSPPGGSSLLGPEGVEPLYQEYMRLRQESGQSGGSMTLDRFYDRLKRNEEQVLKTYHCLGVRFEVGQKDGKVVIKAIPVR